MKKLTASLMGLFLFSLVLGACNKEEKVETPPPAVEESAPAEMSMPEDESMDMDTTEGAEESADDETLN